jgi:hypothetical protein
MEEKRQKLLDNVIEYGNADEQVIEAYEEAVKVNHVH